LWIFKRFLKRFFLKQLNLGKISITINIHCSEKFNIFISTAASTVTKRERNETRSVLEVKNKNTEREMHTTKLNK